MLIMCASNKSQRRYLPLSGILVIRNGRFIFRIARFYSKAREVGAVRPNAFAGWHAVLKAAVQIKKNDSAREMKLLYLGSSQHDAGKHQSADDDEPGARQDFGCA